MVLARHRRAAARQQGRSEGRLRESHRSGAEPHAGSRRLGLAALGRTAMKRHWRATAVLAGALWARPLNAQGGSFEELTRFTDVVNHIRSNYVDSVTYRQLVHSAIDGMLRALDPHSWFLSSEDNDRFNALERGELAVIGVSLELADGVPTILAVSDRSPADRAGIRPGDRLRARAPVVSPRSRGTASVPPPIVPVYVPKIACARSTEFRRRGSMPALFRCDWRVTRVRRFACCSTAVRASSPTASV